MWQDSSPWCASLQVVDKRSSCHQGEAAVVGTPCSVVPAVGPHYTCMSICKQHGDILPCTSTLLFHRQDVRLDFWLEPGDLQLVNNHVLVHTRSAYEDFDPPKSTDVRAHNCRGTALAVCKSKSAREPAHHPMGLLHAGFHTLSAP